MSNELEDPGPTPDQFYTGVVAEAYAPLRGVVAPVDPYERFVRRAGTPALEIGCGHGEPLLDLVGRGLDVVGLDSSADMLALCESEARRRGLPVRLVHQRMEELDIDMRFAAVYFAGPTFQLVIDIEAAQQALDRIARHLLPQGRVLIPMFTPVAANPSAFGVWREHTTATGELLAVTTVGQSFRPAEHRIDTTLRYRRGPADCPIEEVDRVWSLRWYEVQEFESMAARAGLAVHRHVRLDDVSHSFVLCRATERD